MVKGPRIWYVVVGVAMGSCSDRTITGLPLPRSVARYVPLRGWPDAEDNHCDTQREFIARRAAEIIRDGTLSYKVFLASQVVT